MRRWMLVAAAALTLTGASAQQGDPPHAWVFGSWTGGMFPPTDTEGPRCTAQPSVIFTRDLVMRAPTLDLAYRQRFIETVTAGTDSLDFRLVPLAPQATPLGPRLPPDIGFGCPGGPNTLQVERRGPDEIVFPNCAEFPSPLRRCVGR